ncbi:MAG: hypothetical protein WCJ61_12515 [Paludibacter sp.]
MNYFYELIDSIITITVKTEGDITRNDFAETDRLIRTKANELNYKILFDFRNSQNCISIADAYFWFLNFYTDNENALKTIPTAHLSRVEDEPFFKFFETTTNNNGIPIKMFLEEESAMAWLEKHK